MSTEEYEVKIAELEKEVWTLKEKNKALMETCLKFIQLSNSDELYEKYLLEKTKEVLLTAGRKNVAGAGVDVWQADSESEGN